MLRWILLSIATGWLIAGSAHAAVVTESIDYSSQGVTFKGFLAYDNTLQSQRPAVLVVHEWWGHNEYARQRARMLAELGYTAFAIDMYGDGKLADHPDSAGAMAKEASKDPAVTKARFVAALDQLRRHPTVASDKIAAIGYCFGGGVVLNMARAGVDLRGVVSFHGSLGSTSPAQPGQIKAPLLVLNGADDPFVTAQQIDTFKKEMASAQANYRFISYPGAKHGFTSTEATALGKKFNLPLAYNADADHASWREMQAFFNTIFSDAKKP